MAATRPQAVPIDLTTERFLLRSLRREDASERYLAWLADPDVMVPLNRPPAQLTLERLVNMIAGADGIHFMQIGIFERASGQHIGNYLLEVEPWNRNVWFNLMIGDKDFWGAKVVLETRAALLDHMFDARGIEKVLGHTWTRNFPAVFNYKAQGWRLEGVLKSHVPSRVEEGRRDLYQFALLKDEWHALRKAEAS